MQLTVSSSGLNTAVSVEPRRNGRSHAAGRLSEDAFGFGKLLYRGNDLDIGYILCPSTR